MTMRSSHASFDRPIPEGNWGGAIIVAVVITLVFVGSIEAFLRGHGYRPSVSDSRELWSYHRSRIYAEGGESVVLLGASRMQAGFSPKAFRERFPDDRLTQLAVSATSPLATLEDLADDERFVGTVLCALSESAFQAGVEEDHSQAGHVAHYREHGLFWDVEQLLKLRLIESRFAIARPQFRLLPMIRQLLAQSESIAPEFIATQFDRSQQLDFRQVDVKKQRDRRVGGTVQFYARYVPKSPDREAWRGAASQLKPHVDRIFSRGGRVGFIRFPETGEHWRMSESHYPKHEYWDHLAELTGAPTIHFRDVPDLATFECPDTSHLDYRDTYAFTNTLLDECIRLEILPTQER